MPQETWFDAPDHRYSDQIDFVRQFPAYTVDIVWWYRAKDDVASLHFHVRRDTTHVEVSGDLDRARRVMRVTLPLILPPIKEGIDSMPHRSLLTQFGGIRPVLYVNPFEGIAWAILGQQITVAFVAQLKDRSAKRWDTIVRGTAASLAVFPSPAQVA